MLKGHKIHEVRLYNSSIGEGEKNAAVDRLNRMGVPTKNPDSKASTSHTNIPLASPLHPFNEGHGKHIRMREENHGRWHHASQNNHEHQGHHGHDGHHAYYSRKDYHLRGRRRNTFHSTSEVAHANFDNEKQEAERELKRYIGGHHRNAVKSVKETQRFASEIQRSLQKKLKKGLKSKLHSAVHKLAITQSKAAKKKTRDMREAFEESQRKLRAKANAEAGYRHRIPHENALVLLGKHEQNLVSPNVRTTENLKKWANENRHTDLDFSYRAGVRNSPQDWFRWDPSLGCGSKKKSNSHHRANLQKYSGIPGPTVPKANRSYYSQSSPLRKTAGRKIKESETESKPQKGKKSSQEGTNKIQERESRNPSALGSNEELQHGAADDLRSNIPMDTPGVHSSDEEELPQSRLQQSSVGLSRLTFTQKFEEKHARAVTLQSPLKNSKTFFALHPSENWIDSSDVQDTQHESFKLQTQWLEKSKYLSTVARQQFTSREHGAHISISARDGRPVTRSGLSGYMIHRLQKGVPVESLSALSRAMESLNPTSHKDGNGEGRLRLELSNIGVGDDLFISLTQALASYSATRVTISGEKNEEDMFSDDSDTEESNSISLDVSGNRISSRGIHALCDSIEKGAQLTKIVLAKNRMSKCGTPLGRLLVNGHNLLCLDLSSSGMSDSTIRNLEAETGKSGKYLKYPMRKLFLSENRLSNISWKCLSSLLLRMPHLRCLDLSANQYSSDGGAQIIQFVAEHFEHLKLFDISRNPIGAGASAVSAPPTTGLALPGVLESEHDEKDYQGEEDSEFGDVPKMRPNVQRKRITAGSAVEYLLKSLHELEHLKLSYCAFTLEEMLCIRNGILASASLLSVHLDGNPKNSFTASLQKQQNLPTQAPDSFQSDAIYKAIRNIQSRQLFMEKDEIEKHTGIDSDALLSANVRNSQASMLEQHVNSTIGKCVARHRAVKLNSCIFTRELGNGDESAEWTEVESCWICENWHAHTILSHGIISASENTFEDYEELRKRISNASQMSDSESEDESTLNGMKSRNIPQRFITCLFPHHRFGNTRCMRPDDGSENASHPRYHFSCKLPLGRSMFFFREPRDKPRDIKMQTSGFGESEKNTDGQELHARGGPTSPPASLSVNSSRSFFVSTNLPIMKAPIWVQRKYGIRIVNFHTMKPLRPAFDSSVHTFLLEDSILHDLSNCSVETLVENENKFHVWRNLSLLNTLDYTVGEDENRVTEIESSIMEVLKLNAGCLISNFLFACCAGPELKDVSTVSSNAFLRCMSMCNAIDNRSVRSHDVETIFRASCKDQWKQKQARGQISVVETDSESSDPFLELSSSKRMSKRKKTSKNLLANARKFPQYLEFDGFLIAIVRLSLLKYSLQCSSEIDAVKRFLRSNMYTCGQLIIQNFREEFLYTPHVYEVLHEHEGLLNTIFQRFCHKFAHEDIERGSLESVSQPKAERIIQKGIHASLEPHEDSRRLNLPEFWDMLITCKIIRDTSTDRRQLSRQEAAWVVRCCLGKRPIRRGLSFPQFLDAVTRVAMILVYRDRFFNDLHVGLENIGAYPDGGAIDQLKLENDEDDWYYSSGSDNSTGPNDATFEREDEAIRSPISEFQAFNSNADSQTKECVDSGILAKSLHHYLIRPFEEFVKVVE